MRSFLTAQTAKLAFSVITTAITLTLAGCTKETRHELLTFFFTGVPPLDSGEEAQVQPPEKVKNIEKKGKRGGKELEKEKKQPGTPTVPPAPLYYSHPVWFNGQCDPCHQSGRVFAFQTAAGTGATPKERIFYPGGGMPGQLKAAKERLCGGCHSDRTVLRAIRDQLWLHNTTAKGECLACHDPHQSKYPSVLRKPAEKICLTCHSENGLAGLPLHPVTDRDCLGCHNPHLGKDRNLLKSDYSENRQRTDAAGTEQL